MTPALLRRPLLALLLACAPASQAAELIDPAAFGFGRPVYMVDTTFIGSQDFDGGGFETFELRTIVPLWKQRLDHGLRLGLSLGYNLTEYDFSGGGTDRELHTLEAQLSAFWKRPNSPWWGLGFVTPGVGSDFEKLSGEDFQVAALSLIGYEFTDTFSVAGGVFASHAHDEGRVLPALGFIWQPGDWTLQVTPPFLVLGRRLNDKLTVNLSAYPGGGSWDLDEDRRANTLIVSGWQAAAGAIWQFNPRLSLAVRAGINFAGDLEIRDRNDRTRVDESLDPAPFAALNLRFNF